MTYVKIGIDLLEQRTRKVFIIIASVLLLHLSLTLDGQPDFSSAAVDDVAVASAVVA